MSISLYLDENVAGAIAKGLRQRGIDALTVQADGRSRDSDSIVMERAIALEGV